MRVCIDCSRECSLDMFYAAYQKKGLWRCRVCAAEQAKRKYHEQGGREYMKEYYQQNRDKMIQSAKDTQKRDPWAYYSRLAVARARRLGAPVAELVDLKALFDSQNWTCGICGEPVDPNIRGRSNPLSVSVDHIVALQNGGSHVKANLRLAHRKCNRDAANN